MAPFEALYGRKCRSPICWFEVEESKEFAPEYIKEQQQQIIDIIRDRLKIAQSRQKSYEIGRASCRERVLRLV